MTALGSLGTPIRYLATEVREMNLDLAERNLLSLSYGRIVTKDIESNEGLLPASFERYTKVKPGDLVLRLTDLQNDQRSLRTGLVTQPGIITSAYLTLRASPGLDPRFFAYAMYAIDVNKTFYALGGGLRQSMGVEEVSTLRLEVPPLEEQRRIADFLDDQVARIDAMVQARQSQVDLLDQLLESMLSEAFVQHVSAHGLARLGIGLRSIRQGWSPQCEDRVPEDNEWGVLRAGCVNNGVFRPGDLKALPVGVSPRTEFLITAGDLLINRASGSLDLIGSCALVSNEVRARTLLCDKVYRIVVDQTWLPQYTVVLWRSRQVREAIKLGVSGAEGMANSLPSGTIASIRLPTPPREVQHAWLASWHGSESAVQGTQASLRVSAKTLNEFKLALITAAVTGELDVTTGRSGVPV